MIDTGPAVAAAEAAVGELEALELAIDESVLRNELLADFYAFTFEEAVLVGPAGTNLNPSKSKSSSPLKRSVSPVKSPPSPPKADTTNTLAGPSTAHLAPASGISREVMNALLAPKTWRDARGKWQRMVKLTPSARTEVVRLQVVFDQLLEEHQARASAVCPVREKFFLQVFEELIRQSACECPERGLLLLRVRDELRLTIEGYQTLYHNSIAYGRQKAVQAEAGITELEERISQLEQRQQAMRQRKQQLTHSLLFVEAQVEEDRAKCELQQHQLVDFLKQQHDQLSAFAHELTRETTWK